MAPAMHRCLRAAAIAAALAPALGLEAWLKDGGSDPPCALQPSLLETQISAAPPKDASEAVVTKPEVVSEIIGDGKQALEAWNKCNWAKKVIDLAWENSGDWMKPASDHLSETIPDDNGDPDMPEHLWLHQATPVDVPAHYGMCFWESMDARLKALGFEWPGENGPEALQYLVADEMLRLTGALEDLEDGDKEVLERLKLHVSSNDQGSINGRVRTLYTIKGEEAAGTDTEAFVISQYFQVRVVMYSPAKVVGQLQRHYFVFEPMKQEVLGTIWLLNGDWKKPDKGVHHPHWDGLVPNRKAPPIPAGVSGVNKRLAKMSHNLRDEFLHSFSGNARGQDSMDEDFGFFAEDFAEDPAVIAKMLVDDTGCDEARAFEAVGLAMEQNNYFADYGQAKHILVKNGWAKAK